MDSSVLDRASLAGRMVGDGQASGSLSVGQFQVSRSGESIIFTPRDAQGNPSPVMSLRNLDDVQTIQIVSIPAGGSFVLNFGGQNTSAIALQPAPPLTSFVYTATLPQPGTFELMMAWGFYGPPPAGHACTAATVRVYDNGTLIASVPIDQTNYPNTPADLGVAEVGVFRSFGSFTFASNNLSVYLCGATGTGSLLAGMLRVAPPGATDPATIGYIDPSPNRAAGSGGPLEGKLGFTPVGGWNLDYYFTNVGKWHGVWSAAPTGTIPTAFPNVGDVQSALRALPNVSGGDVQVSNVGTQGMLVHFVGSMGGMQQPTLISSDPAFAVYHDGTNNSSVGGQYPRVTVNGVDHDLRGASYAAGQPFALFHILQDAPDVQYLSFMTGLFQSGYFKVGYNVGFGGRVGYPTDAGVQGIYRFQALPANTYQIAITWPGGDVAGDLMDCIIQDGNGNTIDTVRGIDQSRTPGDFQEGGVGWKILGQYALTKQINDLTVLASSRGTSSKHLILDTVRVARIGPTRGCKIHPEDSVSFSAPAGFVTTGVGPSPAVVQQPVLPATTNRMPALPAGPKTMHLGMNMDPPGDYGVDSYYSNIAVQAFGPVGLEQSEAANPTRLPFDSRRGCGSTTIPLAQAATDAGGLGRGVPASQTGVWAVQWRGSSWNELQLMANTNSTTVTEITSRRVTGPLMRRYYQVQEAYNFTPGVSLVFVSTQKNSDSTYACDVTDVAVYPPEIDPDNPPKWRPGFLDKLKGLQCIRFMDLFGTNNLNLAQFEHFPDPNKFPFGYGGRRIIALIDSIGPPTPDGFCDNVAGTVIRVKTVKPHGLTTGFNVRLRSNNGSLGLILGNVVDPATKATTSTARDPIDPTDNYNGQVRMNLCHVIDETTIQIGLNVYNGPLARMTNTLTPTGGYIYADVAPGAMIAPSEAADLAATVGAEPWINVPWLADDDCVNRIAQAFLARIPRGTVVHVEYGNEAWNYVFLAFFYCVWRGLLEGGTSIDIAPVYMNRMAQVHQIFRDAWQAAGRDPGEVRRVCGVQLADIGGTTVHLVNYAVAHGISFDEVAPATYYGNEPASGPLDDLLTREQLLDLMALNVQNSSMPQTLAGHIQAFTTALAQNPTQTWLKDVTLVNYEGGPDLMTTPSMSRNMASRNHGVHRHPEFAEIQLHHLQMLQDAGVKLFNIFTLYGTRDSYQWGVYEGAHMVAGTGDPTIDVANVNDFENLAAIKSETAAALMQWSAMLSPGDPSPPIPTRPILRNGSLLAYGQPAY